ncbi:MAG: hypothetical protein AAGF71_02710 [Pseudomonadota bacterium]
MLRFLTLALAMLVGAVLHAPTTFTPLLSGDAPLGPATLVACALVALRLSAMRLPGKA